MKQKLKQSKGITLISLVVTIIILVILAGVTISLILGNDGIVEKAKEAKAVTSVATAQENLELLKSKILLDKFEITLDYYLEELDKVKEEYQVDDIEKIDDKTAEIIVDGKYKFTITDEGNGNLKTDYKGEAGGIELSAISGTYVYPTTGTFEVVKNISGGELSVKSENENIAKASISGTTVTVISQNVAGTVKIIVTSAANGEYAEQKTVYKATVENGTITLSADEYTGTYDGKDHDAVSNVKVIPTDATVEYSIDGGTFSSTIPKVNGANTYSVSIRATKVGYTTKVITKTITVKEITTTKELPAGAYINYNTGVSSVGTNGVVTCRVLYDASSEYGLQIITDKNIVDITLGGEGLDNTRDSYNNVITTLNSEAEKYLNKTYAVDARCIGSVPTNQNGTFINKNSENAGPVRLQFTSSVSGANNMKGEDTNYTTDQTQMKNLNIMETGEDYWLASRYVYSDSSQCGFCVRYVGGRRRLLDLLGLVWSLWRKRIQCWIFGRVWTSSMFCSKINYQNNRRNWNKRKSIYNGII